LGSPFLDDELQLKIPCDVLSGGTDDLRVVLEHADPAVTQVAEQSANLISLMTVIHGEDKAPGARVFRPTHGTPAALGFKKPIVFSDADAVGPQINCPPATGEFGFLAPGAVWDARLVDRQSATFASLLLDRR